MTASTAQLAKLRGFLAPQPPEGWVVALHDFVQLGNLDTVMLIRFVAVQTAGYLCNWRGCTPMRGAHLWLWLPIVMWARHLSQLPLVS